MAKRVRAKGELIYLLRCESLIHKSDGSRLRRTDGEKACERTDGLIYLLCKYVGKRRGIGV